MHKNLKINAINKFLNAFKKSVQVWKVQTCTIKSCTIINIFLIAHKSDQSAIEFK